MARAKKKRKMTAATLSRLPSSAGGALAGSLARGGYWTITRLVDFGLWTGAQFMRAPVASSTVAVIAGLSLVAGSNALYFQTSRHPAPLFFPPPRPAAPAPVVRHVFPADRPHAEPPIARQTTGSLGNAPPAVPSRSFSATSFCCSSFTSALSLVSA